MKRKSVKEQILQIFLESADEPLSGEALAGKLQVSRTAVWKAVGALREDGYRIEGTPKRGYRMIPEGPSIAPHAASSAARFNAPEIASRLEKGCRNFYDIHTVSETGSTNSDVREAGLSGAPEGYVLLAESQTAGRGRQGRAFYSPKGSGLYMSLLLRPTIPAKDAVMITAMAGVAAARAVESLIGGTGAGKDFSVQIKWVNDLVYQGHTICGILTEGMLSMETGGFDQAVLGLGFNLSAPEGGWPEEIRGIAGGLFESPVFPSDARVRLAAAFLSEFLPLYRRLPEKTFLPEYRARMLVLGQKVDVLEPDGSSREALAEGLDDECRLLVRFPGDEFLTPLGSGEVRIRPIK